MPSPPTAQRLVATGVWKHRSGRTAADKVLPGAEDSPEEPQPKKPPPRSRAISKAPKGDKSRVNIVSDELCDDIISYIGPSLDRHKGCDILDIYPGAGLWSRKLNDYLQPRSHILMEPDAAFYTPFLQDLLDRPGTKLTPKSGMIWKDLNSVLNPEYLPHQQPAPQSHRNDTLLVTANIAFHPRKRFMGFESIARLVQHQFLDAIRSGQIFHRYGQVRMLLWTRRDDKGSLVARSMQRRKRSAIDAELHCEYLHEVCGKSGPDSIWYVRDTNLDRASAQMAARRMRENGIVMPARRTPQVHKDALADLDAGNIVVPGAAPPVFARAYHETLSSLQEANEEQAMEKYSEEHNLLRKLQWRDNSDLARFQEIFKRQQAYDAILQLRAEKTTKGGKKNGQVTERELRKMEAEWDDEFSRLPNSKRLDYLKCYDNMHLVRQDPPAMAWDRRAYEPLETSAVDFFPNTGPNSNRASEIFDLLTRALFMSSASPLHKLLDSVWPGAADWVIPRCKSLHDPKLGGKPVKCQYGRISPRSLNDKQWQELLERWMEWPFRPEYQELLARSQDDSIGEDHDTEDV
ncbi:S-adenosyl-L-methionine-dependent methyltransferase [Apiospora aurea]|uniref:rRNA adenine N(6)-methyltransferase n=1 Tax=Apiospora aurea TaxID=335848 RepID=A0ABR1PX95_9PEZI